MLLAPHDLTDLSTYSTLPMHDADAGSVRALAFTFDHSQVLSVGDDGNFFLYNYLADEELQKRIAENKADLPSCVVRFRIGPIYFVCIVF